VLLVLPANERASNRHRESLNHVLQAVSVLIARCPPGLFCILNES
jgi:hypothetical protein